MFRNVPKQEVEVPRISRGGRIENVYLIENR